MNYQFNFWNNFLAQDLDTLKNQYKLKEKKSISTTHILFVNYITEKLIDERFGLIVRPDFPPPSSFNLDEIPDFHTVYWPLSFKNLSNENAVFSFQEDNLRKIVQHLDKINLIQKVESIHQKEKIYWIKINQPIFLELAASYLLDLATPKLKFSQILNSKILVNFPLSEYVNSIMNICNETEIKMIKQVFNLEQKEQDLIFKTQNLLSDAKKRADVLSEYTERLKNLLADLIKGEENT